MYLYYILFLYIFATYCCDMYSEIHAETYQSLHVDSTNHFKTRILQSTLKHLETHLDVQLQNVSRSPDQNFKSSFTTNLKHSTPEHLSHVENPGWPNSISWFILRLFLCAIRMKIPIFFWCNGFFVNAVFDHEYVCLYIYDILHHMYIYIYVYIQTCM